MSDKEQQCIMSDKEQLLFKNAFDSRKVCYIRICPSKTSKKSSLEVKVVQCSNAHLIAGCSVIM